MIGQSEERCRGLTPASICGLRRDRNFNRGRSTIRRGYRVIVGLASAARPVAACPPSRSCASSAGRPAVAAQGRMPAGPIARRRGTVARAERPRVVAGRREARPHAGVGASADGREARDVPRLAGARVDGGLRAPAWAARERRWARIWSITDAWVMHAMLRMGPRHVGHASGSTLETRRRDSSQGKELEGSRRRS